MGAPEELYELPRTVFVANFLGQSNLFAVEVAGGSDTAIHTSLNGSRITVPRSRSERDSGTITVGVRPEKLRLHASEPAADPAVNVLGPGRITDVSFIGVSTQYTVEAPEFGSVQVFAQNVESLKGVLRDAIGQLPAHEDDAAATCACRRSLDGIKLPFDLP